MAAAAASANVSVDEIAVLPHRVVCLALVGLGAVNTGLSDLMRTHTDGSRLQVRQSYSMAYTVHGNI